MEQVESKSKNIENEVLTPRKGLRIRKAENGKMYKERVYLTEEELEKIVEDIT